MAVQGAGMAHKLSWPPHSEVVLSLLMKCMQVYAVPGVPHVQLLVAPDNILRVPRGAAAAATAVRSGHDTDSPGAAALHLWLPAQRAEAAERPWHLRWAVPQHGSAGISCSLLKSWAPLGAGQM